MNPVARGVPFGSRSPRKRGPYCAPLHNFGRKERVQVDDYTIEHILPQDPNLPAVWRQDLGLDWEAVQERWLHTLGNLTLTGYNSEYSNRSFAEKRDMVGGFRHSPLRVNEGLGSVASWNEEAIKARADRLARMAVDVWPTPRLNDEELADFREEKVVRPAYTLEDHVHLAGGATREIFDAFRREVEALDPCVAVEFLKLYVAFKAETNFVDVVPQARGLRLSLNIEPQDLVDPRGLVVDVSGVGRWGNGNSEVRLTRLEDVPYVLGLVRQSLEQQLGSAEAA